MSTIQAKVKLGPTSFWPILSFFFAQVDAHLLSWQYDERRRPAEVKLKIMPHLKARHNKRIRDEVGSDPIELAEVVTFLPQAG
jgi:hypothetical protein